MAAQNDGKENSVAAQSDGKENSVAAQNDGKKDSVAAQSDGKEASAEKLGSAAAASPKRGSAAVHVMVVEGDSSAAVAQSAAAPSARLCSKRHVMEKAAPPRPGVILKARSCSKPPVMEKAAPPTPGAAGKASAPRELRVVPKPILWVESRGIQTPDPLGGPGAAEVYLNAKPFKDDPNELRELRQHCGWNPEIQRRLARQDL